MSIASLIDAHLEQIQACAQTIAELNFPGPKIFTNALLHPHDITTLIRDTEAHERALFSVPPELKENRRNTVFPTNGTNSILGGPPTTVRGPRRNTAVAAVLGGDLVEKIKKGGGGGAGSALGYREGGGKDKGEVDVEILLEGAEKLCGVYPIPGALEKIADLRDRHMRLRSSLNYYEELAADQAEQLSKLNKPREFGPTEDDDEEETEEEQKFYTEEDMNQEVQETKELERKKRVLEERVAGMEKDLNF